MIEGLEELGITLDLDQFKGFFSYLDLDGDGYINFSEFCKMNLDKTKALGEVARIKSMVPPLVRYSQKDMSVERSGSRDPATPMPKNQDIGGFVNQVIKPPKGKMPFVILKKQPKRPRSKLQLKQSPETRLRLPRKRKLRIVESEAASKRPIKSSQSQTSVSDLTHGQKRFYDIHDMGSILNNRYMWMTPLKERNYRPGKKVFPSRNK